jgi:acetyl-CoA C-acetyltransferase
MTTTPRNRVGIVGAAQTRFSSAESHRQHVDLISETVFEALRGTGLSVREVDFVIDSGSDVLDGRSISNCGFLGAMGAHHKEESRVEEDGLWAAIYAATKIAGGSAGVGLVIAYAKPSESDLSLFYSTMAEPFVQRPVGIDHLVTAGLYADRYLREFGLAADDLAPVREHAWDAVRRNVRVSTDDLPGREDPTWAEPLATPLTRGDISRPVDGAVVLVLARQDIARRITPTPVWITGMGTAMDEHMMAQRAPTSFPACAHAARRALDQAGIASVDALDLIEVSATSTVSELMVLEAVGAAGPGKAIELYRDGTAGRINPSGGALLADPIMATGLARALESVVRMTGLEAAETGTRPRSALVHGTGGLGMQNHCVLTLEA